MKKTLALAALGAVLFAGCATTAPIGTIYSGVELPVSATSSANASKEGRATCKSILGLVAIDDCSVATAAKNGGINEIQSVDTEVTNILGLYGTFTTVVKGR